MDDSAPKREQTAIPAVTPPGEAAPTFEKLLTRDGNWAMGEGSLFFEDRGRVQESLRRIANRLTELNIPYAVCGGMALFYHGYRRFTEDVDILVTAESLQAIHQQLSGRGYLEPFANSKHLRDTESKVKIEFLISGGFPGDGKPKSIAFPDPQNVAVKIDGIRFVNLPTLIDLKLASGISSPGRIKDLADVQELIKTLSLPSNYAEQLNAYCRDKFTELWTSAQTANEDHSS
jgi:hypothetical protein